MKEEKESIFCQVESIFRNSSVFVFCILRMRFGTLPSDDRSEISGHQILGISPTEQMLSLISVIMTYTSIFI